MEDCAGNTWNQIDDVKKLVEVVKALDHDGKFCIRKGEKYYLII